jgi:hypothetical protein
MGAIVQADPYQGLIRKIGYSVGLEDIVNRVKKLVSLYVQDRTISFGAFSDLVENDFGRKRNAAKHFVDFYGTLNLIRAVGRGLEPLYQLDSLSILRRLFLSDEGKFDTALKVVLTQCIIEADGDIFLNALLSDFEPDQMRVSLEAMVHAKRDQVTKGMRSPHLLNKVYKAIDIKNESAVEKVGVDSLPQGRFARRTETLDSLRRTSQLTPATGPDTVAIPQDYLKKTSKTRKAWAQDIGLFQDGKKTERGKQLLQSLDGIVDSTATERAALFFWGYKSDLDILNLKLHTKIEACDCEAWDLLKAIGRAYSLSGPSRSVEALDADGVVELLQQTFELYREGHSSKGLIRNSLPLYIAEPVLASWCVSEAHDLPDLRTILEEEYGKESHRRVQLMNIRGTAGALFFMR